MSKIRGRILPTVGVVCCLVGVLFFPNLTHHSLSASLKRSYVQLIPTLFPMMIFSKRLTITLSDFFSSESSHAKRLIGILSRITAIPEPILPLFFIGMLCGYPLPALLTAGQLREKSLSLSEAETAVALCNNTSPAFLIGFLGSGLFGSTKYGIFLFISQILALIGTAHILSLAHPADPSLQMPANRSIQPAPPLIEDIRSSVYTMLEIIGFTAFFSLLADFVGAALSYLSAPPLLCAAVVSLLEITDGAAALSSASFPVALLLLPFFAGLGGISVLFQIRAVLPENVSVRRWVIARACVAPLMTVCFFVMTRISP